MDDRHVLGGCLLLAIVLAGFVSLLTESPAILGVTPAGIAIYLAVGIGLPQYVLSRRRGSALQFGLATLATIGAVTSVVAGVATTGLNAEWRVGLVPILVAVIVGILVGAGVREFRAGYRTASP